VEPVVDARISPWVPHGGEGSRSVATALARVYFQQAKLFGLFRMSGSVKGSQEAELSLRAFYRPP
jgi:hypothetical protein